MKRFPSLKNVLFCGFVSVAIVLSIPTNPHAEKTGVHRTMPTVAQPAPVNSTANGSTTKPSEKPPTAPKQTQPATPKQSQPAAPNNGTDAPSAPPSNTTANSSQVPQGPKSWGYTRRKTAKLRVNVINGRTRQPLDGAEVVVIENGQRYKTDKNGQTPWFDAPVYRNPRYRPIVAELHGQLGVIVYKNGYRDSIHLGIRMHEGIEQQTTVWMYKLGPEDRRIEPVLYQEPYHHIWLIELADKFRQKSQIGEGPERP